MLLAVEPALSPLQGGRTPVTVRTNQLIHKLDACDNKEFLELWHRWGRKRKKKESEKETKILKKEVILSLFLAARPSPSSSLLPVNCLWLSSWASVISGGETKLELYLLLRLLKIQLAYETVICGDAGDPVDIASFSGTLKHFRELLLKLLSFHTCLTKNWCSHLQGQGVQRSQLSETQEAQETQVTQKENLTSIACRLINTPLHVHVQLSLMFAAHA